MNKKTKHNLKIILALVIFLLLLTGLTVFNYITSKVPSNPISYVGNTPGNIQNGGYFATNSEDGRIYFSNAYDNGYMYSMNPDETDIKKVNGSNSKFICPSGKYVYYYIDTATGGTGLGYVIKTVGLYRSKTNGKDAACLDREAVISMQLIGDYIYYEKYDNQNIPKLFKIKTDKSESILVSDEILDPANAYNGTIYYNGTGKNHYLYALNTQTDTAYTMFEGNIWFPQYSNGYIYYLDVPNNYRLCRYNPSTQTVDVLTEDRVDCYNVSDAYIFYQKSDKDFPALMKIRIDGSSPEKIMDGVYKDINLTSNYAYFRSFQDPNNIYHVPINGGSVGFFNAASEAAIANQKK